MFRFVAFALAVCLPISDVKNSFDTLRPRTVLSAHSPDLRWAQKGGPEVLSAPQGLTEPAALMRCSARRPPSLGVFLR